MLRRLTRSDLTRERYGGCLAAMYPAHARLERQVLGSRHARGPALSLSPRLALLQADLLDLGRPQAALARQSADAGEPRAAWLGRVYVLEGSRLGGAVIARRIRALLGDAVPCRFFGAAAGERSALSAMCARELQDPADLTLAIAGARAAFAAYLSALDGGPRGGAPGGPGHAP